MWPSADRRGAETSRRREQRAGVIEHVLPDRIGIRRLQLRAHGQLHDRRCGIGGIDDLRHIDRRCGLLVDPRVAVPDMAALVRATISCVARRAKHAIDGSMPADEKIPLYRNSALAYSCATSSPVRGAYRDRHETRDGLWRTLAALARRASQGGKNRERQRRATTGAVRVRQNRVVLTPGVCASSPAVMRRPDRARASAIRKATGAIVHRSPGRARHKPSNRCAGKAVCWA